MNTEKKQFLIALRNWSLSLLGIAIVLVVAWMLFLSGGNEGPVEVRPYADPSDTTELDKSMKSTIDWLGGSTGAPQASTDTPDRAPEPAPAAPAEPEETEAEGGEGEEVIVETLTPSPQPTPEPAPSE